MSGNHFQYDHLMKIIVIGDSGVGKSSLVKQFADNQFEINLLSTIGVDFIQKIVKDKNKTYNLQLWDTAGQERFQTMTKSYYRAANAILLVYNVAERDSFKHIENWLKSINENCRRDAVIILIGNKCDQDQLREVETEEGLQTAAALGIPFVETSAKTHENIEETIQMLISEFSRKIVNEVNSEEIPQKKLGCRQSAIFQKCC